jgi:hypothetical protein
VQTSPHHFVTIALQIMDSVDFRLMANRHMCLDRTKHVGPDRNSLTTNGQKLQGNVGRKFFLPKLY